MAWFLSDQKVVSNVEQCHLLRVTKELMKVISYIPDVSLHKAVKDDGHACASTLIQGIPPPYTNPRRISREKGQKRKRVYLGLGNSANIA